MKVKDIVDKFIVCPDPEDVFYCYVVTEERYFSDYGSSDEEDNFYHGRFDTIPTETLQRELVNIDLLGNALVLIIK